MILQKTVPSDRPIKEAVTIPRSKKSKRISGIRLLGRVLLFFLLYFGWPLVRQWFSLFVFLVYPGTIKDSRAYFPRWASKFLRNIFPLGLIRFNGRWGIYAATQTSAEDMDKDLQRIHQILADVRKEFPKASTVALAGRLPGFAKKAGIELDTPFVDGSLGTRFAMRKAALEVAHLKGKNPSDTNLALLGGAGYTGTQVTADCRNHFRTIIAIDPRYPRNPQKEDNVLRTSDPTNLLYADVAVVLTARGDDIEDAVPYFRPGTVVADDTHPCIHQLVRVKMAKKMVVLKKAIVQDGRLTMFPRLPNFRADNIPGCLLEAFVVLQRGRDVLASPEMFFKAAVELGFKAELMEHPDD